jgi:hypothetical protein
MTCPQLVDSGVYVLGALAPAQRSAFERHMATCAECQAEVNDLAVLPGLLGRLDEPDLGAVVELPPPTMLPGVLARVHRQRRGRRLLASAAAVVLAALGLVAGLSMPSSSSAKPPVIAVGPTSTPVAVELHEMLPVGAAAPVTAQVGFTTVIGGTQIDLKCQYPEKYGETANVRHWFALFAIPKSGGTPQQLSSWGATRGEDVAVPAVTSWSVSELSRVELRNASGQALLYYDVT